MGLRQSAGPLSGFTKGFALACLGLLAATATHGAARSYTSSPYDPEYIIDTWEVEQGLPEDSATAMVQTPDGYLWFGTFNGLVRFDGVKFTVFDRSNTPQLPSAGIVNLYLDDNGRLWVSTMLGITYVKDGRWTAFGPSSGWTGDYVRNVAESASGELYMSSFNNKLFLFRGGRFEELPPPPTKVALGIFPYFDAAGTPWVISSGFIGKFVNGGWKETIPAVPLLKSDVRPDLHFVAGPARDGGFWIVTQDRLRKFRDGRMVFEARTPWSLDRLWSVYEDSKGGVWICSTFAGAYRFSPGSGWRHFTADTALRFGATRFAFEDREGNTWVGTSGGGLTRFKRRHFSLVVSGKGAQDRVVKSVSTDNRGRVFLGTWGNGVEVLEGQKISPVFAPASGGRDCSVFYGLTASTLVDHDGRVWAGSLGDGLFMLKDGHCQAFFPGRFTSLAFYALFEDSRHRIWAGTTDGAMCFEHDRLNSYPLANPPRLSSIHAFAEDPHTGTIWAGNQAGGIYRLEGKRFVAVPEASTLRNQRISTLFVDEDGWLWIGTEDGGLAILFAGRVSRITDAQGLPVRSIGSIIRDDVGNFWFGTNRGLLRCSRSELKEVAAGAKQEAHFQVFNISDGLPSLDFSTGYQPTAVKGSDGRLWFATWSGALSVNPRTLTFNARPPQLAIEEVMVDGKVLSTAPPFATSRVQLAAPVRVPPGSHRLEIHYTGLSFTASEKVRFRYMLEGFDRTWIDVQERRVVYLQGIRPGHYRFRLQAANNDGVWSEAGAALDLEVEPQVYETGWFYGLCVLVLGCLAAAIYHLRVRSMHARQIELELRVAERTVALEFEIEERKYAEQRAEAANSAKSVFLATMSHEIRTPMNGIIGMTECALATPVTPEQKEYIGTAKSSAEHLLTVLNDILDFSKIEAGRLELESVPFDLRDVLGQAIRTIAVQAHAKGIEILLRVASKLPETLVGDSARLRQILLNLAGNAVKFTGEGGEILIDADSEPGGNRDSAVTVHFSVSDTGIGVPADKQRAIFEPFAQADGSTSRKYGGTGLGLAITAKLVKMFGGEIRVESEPGRGSVFHFTAQFQVQTPGGRDRTEGAAALAGLAALIVDDNSSSRRILEEMLGAWAMKTATAADAVAGLDVIAEAERRNQPFAWILIDAQMPGTGGFQFVDQIRARGLGQQSSILLLATHTVEGSPGLPVAGRVFKPVREQELLAQMCPASASGTTSSGTTPENRTTRPLRILLAEDNAVNQKVAARMLERNGHSVSVACDGRKALDACLAQTFDLILMDVQMPEMDGFEAIARIREREKNTGHHVPVLALTAHAMSGDRERCIRAGMDGYVTKPIRPAELFEAISGVLALARATGTGQFEPQDTGGAEAIPGTQSPLPPS